MQAGFETLVSSILSSRAFFPSSSSSLRNRTALAATGNISLLCWTIFLAGRYASRSKEEVSKSLQSSQPLQQEQEWGKSLFVCLFVWFVGFACVCLFVCLVGLVFVCMFVCLLVWLFAWLDLCVCLCLFACLFV